MIKRNFCTLFDRNYLLKGIAMIQSLKKHCPEAHVYVLCMDKKTKNILLKLNLSFISCVSLNDIETSELLDVKKNRSPREYCWTLTSCFTWYILDKDKMIDFITYLDADLLFYSPIKPIFDEIKNSSIAIIEHRFPGWLKHLEINGRFCVQWISFRRDIEGMACLSRWREQCIEWCFYKLEDGKLGDQKYLDEWPELYKNCHIIQHIGAGVAPWNYCQYNFDSDNNKSILVNNSQLIFYHFHGFQMLRNGEFDRISNFYTNKSPAPEMVYKAYEKILFSLLKTIKEIEPDFSDGLKEIKKIELYRILNKYTPSFLKNSLRKLLDY